MNNKLLFLLIVFALILSFSTTALATTDTLAFTSGMNQAFGKTRERL